MRSSIPESDTSNAAKRRRYLTPSAKIGAGVLAVIVLAALAPVVFTRANPEQPDIMSRLAPPSPGHLLGTDNIGRDLLARLVYGARTSLLVSVISVGGAALIDDHGVVKAAWVGVPSEAQVSELRRALAS